MLGHPHATRWMAEHGGQIATQREVGCGRMPNLSKVQWRAVNMVSPEGQTPAGHMYNSVGHTEILIGVGRPQPPEILELYRVQYILGLLEEKEWKQSIFMYERKKRRRDGVQTIITLYRDIATEKWILFANGTTDAFTLCNELCELRIFINKELMDISPELGITSIHHLNDKFQWAKKKITS